MAKRFIKDTGGTLTTGLVSYYRLSDTTDFYGSNNLTNNGGATFRAGKYNNGVDFGTTIPQSSKALSFSTGLGIDLSGAFSISFWAKIASTPGVDGSCLLDWRSTTGTASYLIVATNPSATTLGNCSFGGNNIKPDTALGTTWNHFVFTRTGAGATAVYVNGNSVGTGTGANSNAGNKFVLGAYTNIQFGLAGLIDEVGIWSKALSTTEISDLYNSGNGQTMNPPIEFDSISSGQATSTSLTVAHTVGAGSNRCLLVGFHSNDGDLATGITYNSVAMTQLVKRVDAANRTLYVYGLLNPATGTNNIVASVSGNSNLTLIGASYYGVKQSDLPDATTSSTNTSSNVTSASSTLTTVADNAWIGSFNYANGNAQTAGTNTIQRISIATGTRGWYDGGPFTPAGSNTLNFNFAGGTGGGNPILDIVTVSFAPFVAPTTNIKSINGLAYASIKNVNGLATASMKNFNGLS